MRRFEFIEGTSAKFWEPAVEGKNFIVTYGRIGTAGQRKEKAFPSEDAARREMEKKIAEKLREGYVEAGGAAAPASPPPPPARPVKPRFKLDLPPRRQAKGPGAAQIDGAATALRQLDAALGQRSWVVAQRLRQALRALDGVAGHDPPALHAPFDALMARVVGEGARLPLRRALCLCAKLDVSAFQRALAIWGRGDGPGPVALLLRQAQALGHAELALRVGGVLLDRPEHGGSELAWQRRWQVLLPQLSGYLAERGVEVQDFLGGIDFGNDPHLSRRLQRMKAAA